MTDNRRDKTAFVGLRPQARRWRRFSPWLLLKQDADEFRRIVYGLTTRTSSILLGSILAMRWLEGSTSQMSGDHRVKFPQPLGRLPIHRLF